MGTRGRDSSGEVGFPPDRTRAAYSWSVAVRARRRRNVSNSVAEKITANTASVTCGATSARNRSGEQHERDESPRMRGA